MVCSECSDCCLAVLPYLLFFSFPNAVRLAYKDTPCCCTLLFTRTQVQQSAHSTAMFANMLKQLALGACLLAVTNCYDAALLPSTFLLTAFVIGLLWIPVYAVIAALAPGQATLIRDFSGQWRPKGLDTAHFVIRSALFHCERKVIGLAADATKHLATDSDIHLAPDTGVSYLGMSMIYVASHLAFEMGKTASFWMVPVLR